MSGILVVDGVEYRYETRGRDVVAYTWCDCIFGPHWHETGFTARSLAGLCTVLRGGA